MKILIAATAALAAAMLPGRGSPAGKPSAVRVCTYNIRQSGCDRKTPNAWEERKGDLVEEIARLAPDVGGLQEVRPDQMAYLRERLPEYEFVGEHRGADRKTDEASVFYRRERFTAEKRGTFWLSEMPDEPGSKGWGAACPRVCSWLVLRENGTGRRFCFANTHTDHKSAEAREKGMLLVIERMKEFGAGAPIVFTGDHNCRETDAPAVAVSKVLENALYASETPPKGTWRTYNGWKWRDAELSAVDALKLPPNVRNAREGSPDADKAVNGGHVWQNFGSRIDYIYVSNGVRVISYETHADSRPGEKLYPSDHFPVSADIVLDATVL